MEMTTPVISTGGQRGPGAQKMAFVMERKYGERGENLPEPTDSRCALGLHRSRPEVHEHGCRPAAALACSAVPGRCGQQEAARRGQDRHPAAAGSPSGRRRAPSWPPPPSPASRSTLR